MDWLLATIIFFWIIFSPARSWEIEADKSESESEAPKIWNKFTKRLSNSLPSWMKSAHKKVYNTLPAGLLVGVLVFVVYYQAVVKLEEALKSVSHVSVPFVISFIGSLLPFGLYARALSKLRTGTLCAMLVFVASIRYLCTVDFVIFFIIALTIQLQLTYGRLFPSLRWFFRVFVAVFCTKAISHFFGIVSWFPNLFLVILTGILYTFTNSWIHHDTNNAVMIRDGFQVRYFQRGVAKAQMKFIKQRLKVFMFIIGVTTCCTLGHVHPWTTFEHGPETTANVFCKIDSTIQLECLVNTTYNDPHSESQDCKSGSREWDYCGAFVVTSK